MAVMGSMVQGWADRLEEADPRRVLLILCIAAVAVSLIRSILSYKYSLINDDGILYLQAADLIAHGKWSEARAVFTWPWYSALLAGISFLTGVGYELSSQLLAAFCYAAIAVIVLLIARDCSPGNLLLLCAFALLIANPILNQTRGGLLREQPFAACIAAASLFFIRCVRDRSAGYLAGFGLCGLAAAAFRPEAAALLVLIPLVDALNPDNSRPRRVIAVIALLAFFAAAPSLLAFMNRPVSIDVISSRVATLRHLLPLPLSTDRARLAYAGVVTMLVLAGTVSAIGWPSLAYLAIGMRSRFTGINPRIVWALGSIIVAAMLIGFFQVTFSLYFEGRHALPATIAAIPLAAAGYAWITRWWLAATAPFMLRAVLFVAAFALLAYGFVTGLPRPDVSRHQLAAANWIAAEVPPGARVISNSGQVLYYAHRPMGDANFALGLTSLLAATGAAPDIGKLQDWSKVDFLALVLRSGELGLVDSFARAVNGTVVQRFANSRGDEVVIYKIGHAN